MKNKYDEITLMKDKDKFYVLEYKFRFSFKTDQGFRAAPSFEYAPSKAIAVEQYEKYSRFDNDVTLSVESEKIKEITQSEFEKLRIQKIGLIGSLKEKIFGKNEDGFLQKQEDIFEVLKSMRKETSPVQDANLSVQKPKI